MLDNSVDRRDVMKLKPCPFCGEVENLTIACGSSKVWCPNCQILGPAPKQEIITEKVAEAWNTRKESK